MECVFCKIVSGDLSAYKVAETASYYALLDIFPLVPAQLLIISKDHLSSRFTAASKELLDSSIQFAQEMAKNIEAKLPNVNRVIQVIEGLDIDHFHIKLYPAYVDGHGITKSGEKASEKELIKIQSILKV